MQRGSTTEQGRASRDAILDAAVAEFTTKGYRGASVNGIAQRAGITKSGLLHHFESKDALLAAVLAERTATYRAPEPKPLSEDVWEGMRETVAHNQNDDGWLRFFTIMVAESFTDKHPALPVIQMRYANTLQGLSAQFQAKYPHIEPEEATRCGALIIAVMDGLQILRLLDDDFDMTPVFAIFEEALSARLEA